MVSVKTMRRAAVLISLVFVLQGILGICFAVRNTSGNTEFRTGGTSISVTAASPENTVLTSTDNISYCPRVTNKGEDAYVRVKIEARERNSVNDEMINIIGQCRKSDGEWEKKGGYLYLTRVLKHRETADVCREVELSSELEEIMFFDLIVTAECIQAKNVEPDFTNDKPWGNVCIEASYIGDEYRTCSIAPSDSKGIHLAFEGNTRERVKNHERFFAGFGELMPGDVYEDNLEFKCGENADIYFKTESRDSRLNREIRLTVTADGKEYYSGPIAGEGISEYGKILSIRGKNKKIEFRLEVPEEIRDDYQRLNGNVTFFFNSVPKNDNIVKTGDGSLIALALMIMTVSAAFGFVTVFGRRRR